MQGRILTKRILFAEGDGVGPEVVDAARRVIDAGVEKAYHGKRRVEWEEVYIGSKAMSRFGNRIPDISVRRIKEAGMLFKGPVETPVGIGFRSINVFLREALDLYANIRPVKHLDGVPSPLADPKSVDMVIFRENTDDLYTGIEWQYKSTGAAKLRKIVHKELGVELEGDAGLGIKQISKAKTVRITKAAIDYAIMNKRKSITIMHKGNIMKYTEGAFREWAYETAAKFYKGKVVTEEEVLKRHNGVTPKGRVLIKDRIADNLLQQIILKPGAYDIILAPNVNGDYISDAAGALVGNIGVLGSIDAGDSGAMFEPVHGTAPKYAGMNVANPMGAISAGKLMLEYIGWGDAGRIVWKAVEKAIKARKVTRDLASGLHVMPLGTSEFADAVVDAIKG